MPASKRSKKTAQTEASQIRHFKKAARDLGCDESEKAFDKALGKIAKAKPASKK